MHITLVDFKPSLVELGPAVLEKIFKRCQCNFAMSILNTLGKNPYLVDALCNICRKLFQWFLNRRVLMSFIVFAILVLCPIETSQTRQSSSQNFSDCKLSFFSCVTNVLTKNCGMPLQKRQFLIIFFSILYQLRD